LAKKQHDSEPFCIDSELAISKQLREEDMERMAKGDTTIIPATRRQSTMSSPWRMGSSNNALELAITMDN